MAYNNKKQLSLAVADLFSVSFKLLYEVLQVLADSAHQVLSNDLMLAGQIKHLLEHVHKSMGPCEPAANNVNTEHLKLHNEHIVDKHDMRSLQNLHCPNLWPGPVFLNLLYFETRFRCQIKHTQKPLSKHICSLMSLIYVSVSVHYHQVPC